MIYPFEQKHLNIDFLTLYVQIRLLLAAFECRPIECSLLSKLFFKD